MGQAASIITALTGCCQCPCCSDVSKYVLNDCKSSCKMCGCLEVDIETDAVDIASDGSEEELEVQDCLKWHRK